MPKKHADVSSNGSINLLDIMKILSNLKILMILSTFHGLFLKEKNKVVLAQTFNLGYKINIQFINNLIKSLDEQDSCENIVICGCRD